jgi:signal transduction histidine kinase/ActR/RegA family two-component response regulator
MDLSDRNYYRVHREGQLPAEATYVSEVLRGRAQDVIFFQLSNRRSAPDGAFAGVIAISVQPGYFYEFFRNLARDEISALTLIREDAAVLARYPEPLESLPDLPRAATLPAQIARNRFTGHYEATSEFTGVPRLVTYRRLADYPVYVAATLGRGTVIGRWRANLLTWLLYGLPAFLALTALSLIALRLNTRQSRALAQLRDEVQRRESSEAQIRQMQKMEAVGQLTGGVAHDFNNLLTVVMGSLDIARRRLARGDVDILRYVENAVEATQRAATLTGRLLAFARQQPLDPAPTDINKLVRGMSELLQRTLGEQIAIETVLAAGVWQVRIDANQLENAIINLAVNARDAMPSGGKLTVETSNAYLDDAYVRHMPDLAAGQYVLLAVTDTGVGMSPEVTAKAFEPFFTTKPVGQGTGLGLSQVYGFVHQSGGHISIYSEPGQGTTVKLYLPRHVGAVQPAAKEAAAESPRGDGAETVLVVEDQASVRRFTCEALTELGYRVYEADSAEPALKVLAANPEINLLLTDIVMPGMNGRQLAEKAAEIRAMRVLYTTGYTRNAIVHNGMLDPGILLLVKPFTLEELAVKVRQALDRRYAAHFFAAPTLSAIAAPRAPSGLSPAIVVSRAVWCSVSALSSPPIKTTTADSHIHIIMPITAPSEP